MFGKSNRVAVLGVMLFVLLILMSFRIIRVAAARRSSAESSPLTTVADIPLPGSAVCFDYQSLDQKAGRLYISHMNADQLVVFDIKGNQVVANLDGFPRVHGVWAVPDIARLYASITGEQKVAVVDMHSLKTIARVGPVEYPDGLAYAPAVQRVFVSDERGGVDAVIDAKSNTLIKNIPLGGGAGNTVFDAGSGNILVAVHRKNELVSIDPSSMQIVNRLALPGSDNPHGISIDAVNHLAFVACEGNARLFLVDLQAMKVLASYPVGDDPDVLAFDPSLGLLYVSAESGEVRVFREVEKKLQSMGGFDEPHAHTVSVDPNTHLVYFPLENINGHPLLRIMKPELN